MYEYGKLVFVREVCVDCSNVVAKWCSEDRTNATFESSLCGVASLDETIPSVVQFTKLGQAIAQILEGAVGKCVPARVLPKQCFCIQHRCS